MSDQDLLAGYKDDWRDDPLAGYDPDWRTDDEPRTTLGGVARQFGRGVVSAAQATGQGLQRMLPAVRTANRDEIAEGLRSGTVATGPVEEDRDEIDRAYDEQRAAVAEWAGEADTLPEKAAGVAGRLAGEAGQFVASGMGVGALARGVTATGAAGRVASALAKPANLAQRVAQGALADVPITTAQALASPEESITGGLAEMTDSDTLRRLAANPFTRVPTDLAFSLGAGAVADIGLDKAARALRDPLKVGDSVGDAIRGLSDSDVSSATRSAEPNRTVIRRPGVEPERAEYLDWWEGREALPTPRVPGEYERFWETVAPPEPPSRPALPPGQTYTTEPSEFFQPNRPPTGMPRGARQVAEVPPPDLPPSPPPREGWGVGQNVREMWGDLRADEMSAETAARQRVDDALVPTFSRNRPEGLLPAPARSGEPSLVPSRPRQEPEGIEVVRGGGRQTPESGPSRIIRPGEPEFLVDPPRILRPRPVESAGPIEVASTLRTRPAERSGFATIFPAEARSVGVRGYVEIPEGRAVPIEVENELLDAVEGFARQHRPDIYERASVSRGKGVFGNEVSPNRIHRYDPNTPDDVIVRDAAYLGTLEGQEAEMFFRAPRGGDPDMEPDGFRGMTVGAVIRGPGRRGLTDADAERVLSALAEEYIGGTLDESGNIVLVNVKGYSGMDDASYVEALRRGLDRLQGSLDLEVEDHRIFAEYIDADRMEEGLRGDAARGVSSARAHLDSLEDAYTRYAEAAGADPAVTRQRIAERRARLEGLNNPQAGNSPPRTGPGGAGRVSNESGSIEPEVMRALARTGTGAVAGGAVDAAVGDDRSPVEGALVGAALAAGGPSLVRAMRGSASDVKLPRSGTQRGAPYTGPVDPDDFVNVQKFNLSPEGEARLRSAVEQTVRTGDLAPKRRVSWEETAAEAERFAHSIGLDPDVLDKGKLRSSRLTGAQMLGIRDVVNANIRDLEDISRQVASGLDANGAPLASEAIEALNLRLANLEADNEKLLNRFIRARTQTGRDLNNLKILANATLDPATWAARAARVAGGSIDAATQAEIRRLSNAGDRAGLASFVAGLRKAGNLEKLTTLWKAGLLTAPPTHIKNLVGNTTMVGLEEAKNVPAFLFDRLLSTVTGVETKAAPAMARFGSMMDGARKGTREAADIMGIKEAREALNRGEGAKEALTRLAERIRKADLNEADLRKMDLRHVNFDNVWADVYTKGIFKSLGAADRIFRGAAFAGSIDEQARVLARAEGLRGAAFNTRVREIISQPSDEMVLRAIADAEYMVFQDKGALASMLSWAKRGAREKSGALAAVLDVVIPFSQTPANIAQRVVDYSPIGAIKSMNDVVKVLRKSTGEQSLAEAQKQAVDGLGRAVIGAGPMGALAVGWYLASQDRMTGEFPQEERERNAWELEGKTPMSVKVGDRWYSLQGISPLGQVMAVGAQMQQMAEEGIEGLSFAAGTAASIGTSVMELSALQGVEGALAAIRDPRRNAGRWAENLAGSVVPAVVGRAARVGDDVQRTTDGGLERIQSRIPGLRQSLPERINVLGEDVQADPGIIANIFDPFNTRPASDDPLVREMARVGAGLPSLDQRAGEPAEAYRDRQRLYGQTTKQVLESAINTPEYRAIPEYARQAVATEPTLRDMDPEELASLWQKEYLEDIATQTRQRIGTALRGQ